MRRSFGPMGGGGGGGAMMRTVHRVVRTSSGGHGGGSSHQDPFSQFITSHNNNTSSNTTRPTYKPSSSDNNNSNHPNIISLSSSQHHPVNHLNNEYDDYVFATVPSMDEVNHALSSLQQVVDPPTNSQDSGWELDWIEPSTSMYMLQPRGSQSVYDAFRLLQTESSVQKMVVSLASDKSVWEAVMNNEAVRELRDSVNEANKSTSERDAEPSDGSIPLSDILDWIFINTKAKMMEVLEKTIEMVNKLFQSPRNEKNAKGEGQEGAAIEPFGTKLRSSFLMSVLVMLIVVVTRASRS
ncbi:hypothetical protein CTI12_AA120260 [Artemisia annua]|uniref:Uncharacterized protein n=1 Tax=Artemisia annua TaxID=35608 RepID=A0A2U1PRZ0_ARTAN|nr:hypothetical protein CTI12_AA120260 [Artemisia annua]